MTDKYIEILTRADKTDAPPAIGRKFDRDGRVLSFPGASIVCHVLSDSKISKLLREFTRTLKSASYAQSFVFLPDHSLHMTLFECVNDQNRDQSVWPAGIDLDTPLDVAVAKLADRLENYSAPEKLNLKPTHLSVDPKIGFTLVLHLEPQTKADKSILEHIRNDFKNLLEISKPNHDSYKFHISLCYQLDWLSERHARQLVGDCRKMSEQFTANTHQVELSNPALCRYENMAYFKPILEIGIGSSGNPPAN